MDGIAGSCKKVWFAMRALFNHEMKIKAILDAEGVENFLPTRTVVKTVAGKKARVDVPAVSNLIFVRSTEIELKHLVESYRYFQFTYLRGCVSNQPLVVPDKQMYDFIAVANTASTNRVIYFTVDELAISKGTRIRIHGGALDGVEAVFMKVKGVRSKCIVVNLNGIATIAADVHPDLVEVLEPADISGKKKRSSDSKSAFQTQDKYLTNENSSGF